jgi:hypothetical protein
MKGYYESNMRKTLWRVPDRVHFLLAGGLFGMQ